MGDKCQVSGWKNANSKLIHWNVTIVDDSLCGDAFEKYNATENLGCAQGEEVNKYRFLRNNKGADLNHYFILGYNILKFSNSTLPSYGFTTRYNSEGKEKITRNQLF